MRLGNLIVMSSALLLLPSCADRKVAVAEEPAAVVPASAGNSAAEAKMMPQAGNSLRVFFWNAENLYDLVDDPLTGDENWLPGGRERWSERVLADKIANMGEMIRAENPDVIGLVEIESQAVVDRLMREGMKVEYPTSIADARGDARGIRAGFISRFPTVDRRSHQVWNEEWINEDGKHEVTRDILEVTVDTGASGSARYVTFLVNHWPSRSGGEIRIGWRKQAAAVMARRTAELFAQHPDRLVVSMGDFNDELKDPPFTEALSLLPPGVYRGTPDALSFLAPGFELLSRPFEEQGTYYWHGGKVWNILDHVLVAEGPSLQRGVSKSFAYRPGSFRVVRDARFEDARGIPNNCSVYGRRDAGDESRCMVGVSDHRPVVADFIY